MYTQDQGKITYKACLIEGLTIMISGQRCQEQRALNSRSLTGSQIFKVERNLRDYLGLQLNVPSSKEDWLIILLP